MTSKERMMRALRREVPDRLPVTIHQWQEYHLRHYMQGVDQLQAFKSVGLDAAVSPWPIMHRESPDWRVRQEPIPAGEGETSYRVWIDTPGGELTYTYTNTAHTGFLVEHPVKTERDALVVLEHFPRCRLMKDELSAWYDRTGDAGIVRGHCLEFWMQPGSWQDFAEMAGTQAAILWAMDDPKFVHYFLGEWTKRKVRCIYEELNGAKFDLCEHGGGAASSNVISPAMFDEFCAPYDRQVADAFHAVGLPMVYHTCGWMMQILDRIPNTGCDASETLTPPASGGDIRRQDRPAVKQRLGGKVALVGGLDHCDILTNRTPADVEREVVSLFETFGLDGGYICSASDHFFDAPVENLRALARAGERCRY